MEELTIQRRYVVQTPEPEHCCITLAGCGGTGSFLALHLARLVYHLRDRHGYELSLTFMDPDIVETKNLGRQNFAPAEVGRNKAETLAWRYNLAFGLGIQARAARLADARPEIPRYQNWALIIGAVDNADARASIAELITTAHARHASRHAWWWLDCGNEEHAGQVILGDREDLTEPEISPLGFCAGLPLPSVVAPDLVSTSPPEEGGVEIESCAELAVRDAQSLMVNQAIAGYAAQYVYRQLVSRDLDISETYVDLVSGSARSVGITGHPVPNPNAEEPDD